MGSASSVFLLLLAVTLVGLGLVIILINWAAVAFVTWRFWRIEKRAGALMLSLLLWLSFASYLNGFIVLQHP